MLVWAAGLMSGLAHSSEPPRPGLSPDAAREPARPGTRAGGIPAEHLVEREGVYYETNSRTPFTGEAVSCHKNGQPEYKGHWKDGNRHGLWESYHKNGQPQAKGNFRDGKWHGLVELYDENGQLELKAHYRDGNLQRKVNWKAGKQNGLFEEYYENGQTRLRENWKHGKLHGLSEWYGGYGIRLSVECYQGGNQVDLSLCSG